MAYGLTLNQAKIYITMIQFKVDTIKAISNFSKLPVESIYRSIEGLEKKHLVEKQLSKPIKFKVLAPKEALLLLKKMDNDKRVSLYKQTDFLVKELINNKPTAETHSNETDTALISSYDAFIQKLGLAVHKMNKTFQGITCLNNFRLGMLHNGRFYEKCVKRGVKCYHIVTLPPTPQSIHLGDSHLLNTGCWERKFIKEHFMEFAIIDKRELFMSLTVPQQGKNHRAIHTTNSCLLTMAMTYFDMLWINGEEA
ncbi:MAG: hypothetical protein NWE95_00885 [Candidatus Bathyarchaeota archaeon]|nr:hypothetical protein [Candidatus Bathyarchaeota archaeon]